MRPSTQYAALEIQRPSLGGSYVGWIAPCKSQIALNEQNSKDISARGGFGLVAESCTERNELVSTLQQAEVNAVEGNAVEGQEDRHPSSLLD